MKTHLSGIQRFGWQLLSAIRERNPEENVLLSPTSLGFALAMAAEGASGETRLVGVPLFLGIVENPAGG